MPDQNEIAVESSKEAPVGVKIISVLSCIGAAILAILAIVVVFAGGSILASLLPGMGGEAGAGGTQAATIGFGIVIVAAIIMLAIAVLNFFIGRGLWKLQSWARIIVIILSLLGFVSGLLNLISGVSGSSIVGLIINGLIAGYMLFSSNVKAAFAR